MSGIISSIAFEPMLVSTSLMNQIPNTRLNTAVWKRWMLIFDSSDNISSIKLGFWFLSADRTSEESSEISIILAVAVVAALMPRRIRVEVLKVAICFLASRMLIKELITITVHQASCTLDQLYGL